MEALPPPFGEGYKVGVTSEKSDGDNRDNARQRANCSPTGSDGKARQAAAIRLSPTAFFTSGATRVPKISIAFNSLA